MSKLRKVDELHTEWCRSNFSVRKIIEITQNNAIDFFTDSANAEEIKKIKDGKR